MSRRRTVEQWRIAVVRDPHISDATRVLLLVLADSMTTDLRVSVTREELARRLARSERRVSERLAEAIGEKKNGTTASERTCRLEHRLLDRVVRGQKHVAAAVYQALVPDYLSGTHVCPPEVRSQGDGTEHPENDEKCPPDKRGHGPQGDTRGSRLMSADPLVSGQDRKRRSYEWDQPPEACLSSLGAEHPPCIHGMPGGELPDPWLPGSRVACPACALADAIRASTS